MIGMVQRLIRWFKPAKPVTPQPSRLIDRLQVACSYEIVYHQQKSKVGS